jgi:hypothetical protein
LQPATRHALVGFACYAMGMNNKKHRAIISAKAGILGGRFRGSLRVYSVGEGAEADIYFSFKLWQAALQRQERLSAAYAAR